MILGDKPLISEVVLPQHGFLSSATLSHRAAVGSGTFPGDAKPLGLDIQWSVDHLDTYVTESCMP
jgi:hypothetical protein